MRENDCVDVVSQEMVPEVFRILHLLLSVFFGCICQRVHAHTARDAHNTVIGENQRGFFGAAGQMARFAQPLINF